MFSFWLSSLSVYFYTLTTNTNTVWPLAKGEVLQLSVPMKGIQVSVYSTKSQVQKGYEFEILDETSLQYASISSQEIQKRPIQFIHFCSTSGKIIVTATEDVELRIISSAFDPTRNSDKCPGSISLSYFPNDSSSISTTSQDGFDFLFESLPAVGSFLLFLLFLAIIAYVFYTICIKVRRNNNSDSAVPPILNHQNVQQSFNQYIPPHHKKEYQTPPVQYLAPAYPYPNQMVQQPVQVQYGQPILYSQTNVL